MGNISYNFQDYSIKELRSTLRGTNKDKFPQLFQNAKKELENKINTKKDIGDFIFKDNTESFLDSYIDENTTELFFDKNSIKIKNKTHKANFYLMMFVSLTIVIIIAVFSGKNDYFLLAFLPFLWIYIIWRLLSEVYQYSRETIINFSEKKIYLKINRMNNTVFKFLFNLKNGEYTFEEIEGFYRKVTRNLIYEPTNWLYNIRVYYKDKTTTDICFSDKLKFANSFVSYLNSSLSKNNNSV